MPIMCQALYYMLVIYQLVPKKHDFYHQRLCNQKARQNLNKKKCNHFTKKKKKVSLVAVGCHAKHFINNIHFFTFIHLFIQQHVANHMPEIVLGAGVGHKAVKKTKL